MGAIGKVFQAAVKQALRLFAGKLTPAQAARAAERVFKVAEKAAKAKR